MEWIEQDTGGGVICIGTDIGDARCLVMNWDSAAIYPVTARQWFDGEVEDMPASSATIIGPGGLHDYLLKMLPDDVRSEAVSKWVGRFGKR